MAKTVQAKTIHPFPSPSRGSDSELAYASPRGSTTEAGKEGWDRRKRRLRGYNNDKGELTKDGFCKVRRAGGPYLCSLPIELRIIPREHRLGSWPTIKTPTGKNLFSHIHEMLRDRNIRLRCEGLWDRPGNVALYLRQSIFNPEPEPIPTVIIKANRDTVDNAWVKAARDIYAFLCEMSLEYVSVEFVTHPRDDPPYTFPVRQNHPVCGKWDSVLAAILRDVDLTDVCAIGCYTRGGEQESEGLLLQGYRSEYRTAQNNPLKVAIMSTKMVEGKPESTPTLEFSFTECHDSHIPLTMQGDSGSLVFLSHLKGGVDVMGMLWGGLEFNSIGFFTRMDHLFNDIKEHTGARDIRMYGA